MRSLDQLIACTNDPATRERIRTWIADNVVELGQMIQVSPAEMRHAGELLEQALEPKREQMRKNFGRMLETDGLIEKRSDSVPFGHEERFYIWAIRPVPYIKEIT